MSSAARSFVIDSILLRGKLLATHRTCIPQTIISTAYLLRTTHTQSKLYIFDWCYIILDILLYFCRHKSHVGGHCCIYMHVRCVAGNKLACYKG